MACFEMDVASKKLGGWPHLLDMTKAECRKTLRALELAAYSQSVAVLRAQGELTKEKRKLLNDLQAVFSITLERHRAEIRKAVNDEKLNTIAETLAGPNTGVEWAVEGRRLIPLMPRVPPQTAYTALATRMAMLYYGINEKVPHPATTAQYGKMDDLGAESDDTDSEEETEGLRYISQPMVPHQYNADQGSYTTLPHSQARQARMTSKENRENREAPVTSPAAAATVGTASAMILGGGGGGVPGSMNTSSNSGSGCLDKRKRKRSSSTDHPSLPPPSPAPQQQQQQQQQLHQPTTPTKQNPGMGRPMGGGPPMKITVTGNVTRSIPGTPVSTFAAQHTQKVILVSTSGASGVGGSLYQRSMTVPMIKNPNSGPPPPQPPQALMRGLPPTAITATSTIQSVSHVPGGIMVPSTYTSSSTGNITANAHPPSGMAPGTYVSRMRPSAPSRPTMPPRPRQRSNSLVLNTDPIINSRGLDVSSSTLGGSSSMSNCGSSINSSSSGINSGSLCSTSSSAGPGYASSNTGPGQGVLGSLGSQHAPGIPQPHLLQHQTIQVRPGTPVTPGKTAIQIRQEGGAKIITHSVAGSGINNNNNLMNSNCGVGNNFIGTGVLAGAASTGSVGPNGRVLGRPPLPVPSTITQQGPPPGVGVPPGGPLYVVTTNSGTITVVTRTVAAGQGMRAAAPTAVVSVGPKTVQTVRVTPQGAGGLRPMLGGTKSNVIVVHKGAPHPGAVTRPISSIPTIREAPTKITIGKPVSSSGQAMLGKQVTSGGGMRMGPPLSGIPGSTANTGPMVSAGTHQSGNVIVVDMSHDQQAAAAATVAAVSVNSNSLADLLQASGEHPHGNVTVSSAIASSSVQSIVSSHVSSDGMSSMARASILNCAGVNSSNHPVTTVASVGGGSGAMEGEWMAAMEEEVEEETGTDHSLPEGQMQMLEEAVEILGRGDKESARNLLRQAGIELLDSPGDMDHSGFSSVQ